MGRPPGAPNKSTARADLTCQVRGYDSIESMINAAEISLRKFIEHSEKEEKGTYSPMESKAADYLKLYVKIATDMASFIHPKRKAIEYSQKEATEGMTPEQKLEAMKQAVLMLELQIKQKSG